MRLAALRHLAAFSLLAAAGCGRDPASPEPPPLRRELPRPLSAGERALVSANTAFAFGLLREASADAPAANVFVSPFSASMALGMAAAGARGATADSMRHALGTGALSADEANAHYRSLRELLGPLDPTVESRTANAVFARQGFPVEPAYARAMQEFFGAVVRELDFGAPSAAAEINRWVREQTAGKIDDLVPTPLPGDAVMYLVNATYFKGSWRAAFDPARTRPLPFAAPAGPVTRPLMDGEHPVAWYHGDGQVALAEVPYGNGAYVMSVIVPTSGATIDELVAGLTAARWEGWVAQLRPARVRLVLPRFRLEWKGRLVAPLTRLGMGIAFEPGRADFGGISAAGGLFVSDVVQKTFVDVNEQGTEAAAATAVEVSVTSAPTVETVRADRPFVVLIRERLSGTVLFAGKIVAP